MPGIIAGIDGSSHSQYALEWAMRESAIRREPLTVITVQPIAASGWGGVLVFPGDEEIRAEAQQAAQKAADKAAQQLGDTAAPSVTVRAVIGSPAEVLIEASRDADLLVVGSRGAGGFTRLVMGSVSSQVSHHARCPVVIVPEERHQ